MKRWKDPFPPTPQGFHDRVEATLRGLEDTDMRKNRNYRKLTVALIAALIALLAIGAVALVTGNARFKEGLTEQGAGEVAALVQEPHISSEADGAADGFSLTIDEIIWEDDQLYFSYTARVPDDGERYLMALYTPMMNGDPMVFSATGWEEEQFFDSKYYQYAVPMGGRYPVESGQLLTFEVDPALRERVLNALTLRADFFKTDMDFTGSQNGFVSSFKAEQPSVCLMFGSPGDLDDLVSRMELPAKEAEVLRSVEAAAGEDRLLTPEELSAAEHFDYVTRREVNLPVDASKLEQIVYDGVEQSEFEVRGCRLTVEAFRMTHLRATIRLRITAPAGVSEAEGSRMIAEVTEPMMDARGYSDYYWNFFRPDGSLLSLDYGYTEGGGDDPLPDGTPSWVEDYDIEGVIPLEGLDAVIFMPQKCEYDENDQPHYDYLRDWAIALKPVLSEAPADVTPVRTLSPDEQAAFDRVMNGGAVTKLERRVAAANWQAGDESVTVWATDKGTYYHINPDCSGMRSPHTWAIEDAVEAGKKPCPACIGGPRTPAELEDGEDSFSGSAEWKKEEDISNFDD